jgi:hypothetical protein
MQPLAPVQLASQLYQCTVPLTIPLAMLSQRLYELTRHLGPVQPRVEVVQDVVAIVVRAAVVRAVQAVVRRAVSVRCAAWDHEDVLAPVQARQYTGMLQIQVNQIMSHGASSTRVERRSCH